ncbi:MAG TPA: Dam family site-specific DNA-(adenine-N6)-methyltransferase [Candidatus Binataceae bacterium]|nr:Dam family site-specific DNA-(adenine-N6)-methyltransferase [Candidatus Binataceae bacterium]
MGRAAETAGLELETLKPPLKWAGGKRWLVPGLRERWPVHAGRRLVEPFCGGLAVALGLRLARALLNDINPHAVNFYRWLAKGLQAALPQRNDERVYYANRDRFNQLAKTGAPESAEAAELFYYLNRTGYNGLCRFNSAGSFNVPFGKYKTIRYLTDFSPYRTVFAEWKFSCGDFARLALEPGDFVYADPPYDAGFTKYSREDFTWKDQVRLAEWLARHPGPVAASNHATARIIELYRGLGFELIELEAPRMISCTGDRTRAREVLALRGV